MEALKPDKYKDVVISTLEFLVKENRIIHYAHEDLWVKNINKCVKIFVPLLMLLQLENNQQDDVNKLLAFAKQNYLKLSVVDNSDEYYLAGKPLTDNKIAELIKSSPNRGTISMQNAHSLIRKDYDVD